MTSFQGLTVALLAVLLHVVVIMANFELKVSVDSFNDRVNDCGGLFDICFLYINEICLGPQIEDSKSCSLEKDKDDLNELGLPKTRTLTVVSQPWPVDFQLYLDIKDFDAFNSDDDIDTIVIRTSLNTSSVFTAAETFSGNRISLSLRFRVYCLNGYEGPYCDCLPQDDSINGHYQCEADGSISCLPGYTNTTGFCRQVIPACSHSPCSNGTTCLEGHSCNCTEGFVGDKCPTPVPPTPSPKHSSQPPQNREGSDPPPPQNREGSGGMSNAAIAGIVAGALLALLICVVLIAVGLCVQFQRRRVHVTSTESPNGQVTKLPVSSAPSSQSGVVSNPTYGGVGLNAGTTGMEGTLRHLKNPLYGDRENPMYGTHCTPEEMYSVPRGTSIAAVDKRDGGVYSVPSRGTGDGSVMYATMGNESGSGGATVKYNKYATEGLPQSDTTYNTLNHGTQPQSDTTYNTLDHGTQSQNDVTYNTLNHGTQYTTYNTLDYGT